MRWGRVFLFVTLSFAGGAVAAFPFGFLAGFMRDAEVTLVARFGAAVTVFTTASLILGVLAVIQRERVAAHVYATALLSWAISFLPNVLIFGQPMWLWAAGSIVSVAAGTMGLGFGLVIRSMTQTARAPGRPV